MLLVFNGVDGSGKSYQANLLVERLRKAGYPAVSVWGGGKATLAQPMIRLGKLVMKGPRKRDLGKAADAETRARYDEYVGSTQKMLKRPALRSFFRSMFLFDHALEVYARIVPRLLMGQIVVCDRYIYDSMIRVALMSGTTPEEFGKTMALPFYAKVPQPAHWFFLDVPPDVAFARKDDILDVAFLQRRIPFYDVAIERLGMQVIDGTQAPEVIAETVWQSVQPLLTRRARSGVGSSTINR